MLTEAFALGRREMRAATTLVLCLAVTLSVSAIQAAAQPGATAGLPQSEGRQRSVNSASEVPTSAGEEPYPIPLGHQEDIQALCGMTQESLTEVSAGPLYEGPPPDRPGEAPLTTPGGRQ